MLARPRELTGNQDDMRTSLRSPYPWDMGFIDDSLNPTGGGMAPGNPGMNPLAFATLGNQSLGGMLGKFGGGAPPPIFPGGGGGGGFLGIPADMIQGLYGGGLMGQGGGGLIGQGVGGGGGGRWSGLIGTPFAGGTFGGGGGPFQRVVNEARQAGQRSRPAPQGAYGPGLGGGGAPHQAQPMRMPALGGGFRAR